MIYHAHEKDPFDGTMSYAIYSWFDVIEIIASVLVHDLIFNLIFISFLKDLSSKIVDKIARPSGRIHSFLLIVYFFFHFQPTTWFTK